MHTLPRIPRPPCFNRGFTLVELLVTLLLTGLLSVMLFTAFSSVSRSWSVGREIADRSDHSDFIMDQIESALRSAYTPGEGEAYGLKFENNGDDENARDRIEWTKIGPALIGEEVAFSSVPHRVHIFIADESHNHPGGFAVCAWRQSMRIEEDTGATLEEDEIEAEDEFRPEEEEAFLILSPKVQGLNIRILDPEQELDEDEELQWIEEDDEWTNDTILPTAIEVTLWMKPPEDDADPIEYKRIIHLPVANISQNTNLATGANQTSRGGASATEGTRPNANNRPGTRPGGTTGSNPPPIGGGGVFQPPAPR